MRYRIYEREYLGGFLLDNVIDCAEGYAGIPETKMTIRKATVALRIHYGC